MDECELEDIGQTCAGTCINTIGSFRCSEEDGAEEEGVDEEPEEAEAIQEDTSPSSTTESTTTTLSTTSETTTTTLPPTSTTTTTTTTPATTTTTTEPTTTTTTEATTTSTTTATTTTTTARPTESTTTEVPYPEEEPEEEEGPYEDGEEGEDGEIEGEEPEEKDNHVDNNISIVETKENKPELDQTCPEGFQLADRLAGVEDGSPCFDVDECATDNFKCSHICVNTQGSAHCECPTGWTLNDDHKTCTGKSLHLILIRVTILIFSK